MKLYESPSMEIIELRPEERIAYTCAGETSNGFKFSITDDDDDGFFDGLIYAKRKRDSQSQQWEVYTGRDTSYDAVRKWISSLLGL